MRSHGLGDVLDQAGDGGRRRKLLWNTILATDMKLHAGIMERFQMMLNGDERIEEPERKVLLCQALIKCADISNPVSAQCWGYHC